MLNLLVNINVVDASSLNLSMQQEQALAEDLGCTGYSGCTCAECTTEHKCSCIKCTCGETEDTGCTCQECIDDNCACANDDSEGDDCGGDDCSSSNYGEGWMASQEDCTITQFYDCTTDLSVKILGQTYTCKIGFVIPYDVEGTETICTYTGGPTSCGTISCEANGS